MSLSDETASLQEVADALGRRPEWLRRNWLRLAIETGFPRRHASGWTWPRRAVVAWLRSTHASPAWAQPRPSDNDNAGEDPYAAALDERYGGKT